MKHSIEECYVAVIHVVVGTDDFDFPVQLHVAQNFTLLTDILYSDLYIFTDNQVNEFRIFRRLLTMIVTACIHCWCNFA
jgi:hypothetical protein